MTGRPALARSVLTTCGHVTQWCSSPSKARSHLSGDPEPALWLGVFARDPPIHPYRPVGITDAARDAIAPSGSFRPDLLNRGIPLQSTAYRYKSS